MQRRAPASLVSIAKQLDSLQRHIESLDRSVKKLADRLTAFDDEKEHLLPSPELPAISSSPLTLDLLSQILRRIDSRVGAIERDFGSVRARIEDLERMDLLSDEIKPYLKPEYRKRHQR